MVVLYILGYVWVVHCSTHLAISITNDLLHRIQLQSPLMTLMPCHSRMHGYSIEPTVMRIPFDIGL